VLNGGAVVGSVVMWVARDGFVGLLLLLSLLLLFSSLSLALRLSLVFGIIPRRCLSLRVKIGLVGVYRLQHDVLGVKGMSMWSSDVRRAVVGSLLIAGLLYGGAAYGVQLQSEILTEKGEMRTVPVSHPLEWWTRNPLRLDTSGDLMVGYPAAGGVITVRDYVVERKVTEVGVLAGHRIMQMILTIHPGSRVIDAGYASGEVPDGQWKSLLVQDRPGDHYIEIYGLRYDVGGLMTMNNAAIYGVGPDAVLGSFDPDTGNGGGCADGYWWFDQSGVHEVNFGPLIGAIDKAVPQEGRFTPRCWALQPKESELSSGVQRKDATCHACGWIGKVEARYRIEHGSAVPVSVRYVALDGADGTR